MDYCAQRGGYISEIHHICSPTTAGIETPLDNSNSSNRERKDCTAERRKINLGQPRGSESRHMRGNTKSLRSSEFCGYHWGAAHFPARSPFIGEIRMGQVIFHTFAQLTTHRRLKSQWHNWNAAPWGAVSQRQPRTWRRECEVHCCTTDLARTMQRH